MPWRLDKDHADFKTLTLSEQARFDEFQNSIHHLGMHPRVAAQSWDSNYKELAHNQFQIRLSQGNRCTFIIDEGRQLVTILQVGGHT
ncbi:hypothetical protein [Polyangium aurulentum]|uniref:hypothetical protein n=1 Tax=Polyangium aurulentum TaxID=2567896 RepID=UPI0010AE8435|nr:hypothetical protein [Polyangium aurulentum]UQA56949.1 hypothetical protein E8A73_037505 [Polyangium aurulentum]